MRNQTGTLPPAVNFIDYIEDIAELSAALSQSVQHHRHLCPRQVLGARIGLAGIQSLGIPVVQEKKELLVIAETDGCFLSGLEAATDVSVNHRTMRIADIGKLAATFVHVATDTAVRVSLNPDVREKAWAYANGDERRHYFAMLTGYQRMPDSELMRFQAVRLIVPAAQLISRPGIRTNCTVCGEEVINEREVYINGAPFCLTCAGNAQYYDQR